MLNQSNVSLSDNFFNLLVKGFISLKNEGNQHENPLKILLEQKKDSILFIRDNAFLFYKC